MACLFPSKKEHKLEKQLHRALYSGESGRRLLGDLALWHCFGIFITQLHEDQYLWKGLLRFLQLKSDLWNSDGPIMSALGVNYPARWLFLSISLNPMDDPVSKSAFWVKTYFLVSLPLNFELSMGFFSALNRLYTTKTKKCIARIPLKMLGRVSKNNLNLLLIPVPD